MGRQLSRRGLLFGLAGCGVVSTVGLVAASAIKSPEQALADATPPPKSVLTAVVESRVITATVTTRGQVVAQSQLDVTPVVAGAEVQVVTAVRTRVGREVNPGQVLLAVSGRPLFVFKGKLPAYRNLKPAGQGQDVSQLQNALRSLGHYRGGDRAGYFGASTKAAVRRFYQEIGYDVPDTGGPGGRGDRAALEAARQAVVDAQEAIDTVERRIATHEQIGPGDKSLGDQLADARDRLDRAKRDQAELIASTGPMVPLSEFAFAPTFPLRVASLAAQVGQPVKPPLITLSGGKLAVRVKLRPDQAKLVRPDMPASIVSDLLGQRTEGAVNAVGPLTADITGDDKPAGKSYHPTTITPDKQLAAEWAGQEVRVEIAAAQGDQAVLAVPLSAISSGADGRTSLQVLEGDANRRVIVEAGVSGDGYVGIQVVEGELAVGDRVMVGLR